jgi:lysozyme family protein
MKENFESALAAVLHHEGGYVDHPKDPGGRTNRGVTQRVWEEWVGHPVDEATMRGLTEEDVAPLYKAKYWNQISGDDLPAGVDYCVFDAAINSGPGRAAKWLQQVVGVTADGSIGPGTLRAVAAMPAHEIVSQYQAVRLDFLQRLPTWETFGKGWGRRVTEVATAAGKMTDGSSNLA